MGYALEVKHCGGREPLEVVIERYQPQLQWTMFVTGTQEIALSVILGASEPVVEYIDRDDAYIAEMVKRGEEFMEFVRNREPPVVLDPVPTPIVAVKTYDYSTDNTWVDSAADWIATKPFSDRCRDAEKILKAKVPEDARKVFGGGVRITRDRAGRLSLRVDE